MVKKNQKVALVAVDLGYGHQRAAFPLCFLDGQAKMTLANNYIGIPDKDKRYNRMLWGVATL